MGRLAGASLMVAAVAVIAVGVAAQPLLRAWEALDLLSG
jgi:hypothetical protein